MIPSSKAVDALPVRSFDSSLRKAEITLSISLCISEKKASFMASPRNQRADVFAAYDALDVAFFHEIKDHDREVVVHAEGDRRRVHHLELFIQYLDVAQAAVFLGVAVFHRVRIEHAGDFGGLENHLGADLHGAEARGRIGGEIGIARAAGEDDDAPFLQMARRAAANV